MNNTPSRPAHRKFFIRTFGCQMNENDSEHIAGLLSGAGMEGTEDPDRADILIVNTCSVREKSEEKLFSFLGRLSPLRRRNGALLGVVGCAASLHGASLLKRVPGIDFIVGPDGYSRLPEMLSREGKDKILDTHEALEWEEPSPRKLVRQSAASAFVTIMEGCNNFCAYCVVPFTRGREKYRPLRNILQEIHDLQDRGYKEIQLLGQNVNSYVDPQTGRAFPDLLRECGRFENIPWVRFITSHPKNFTTEIIRAMESTPNVCRQLHLPLQSGSTAVLSRMKRGYNREDYLTLVSSLRGAMPGISLSTDIIVGFPGESEEQFQETLELLDRVRFTNIFSFRYSPRPRTAALKMANGIPLETKKQRLIEVQALQKRIQWEDHRRLIGQRVRVLCLGRSKKNDSVWSGRAEGYQVVNFIAPPGSEILNTFVDVLITGCGPYSLTGEFSS